MSLGEEEEEGEDREVQVQEGGRGEPPPEESKLSRLFYLQLYSSVLNAEKAHKKREKERRRKERRSLKLKLAKKKVVKSLSWMDVTNLLARSFSTEGSTRDKDIGDVEVVTEVARVGRLVLPKRLKKSFVKDVMVDRRLSVGRGQYLPQAQVNNQFFGWCSLLRLISRWVFHSLVAIMGTRVVVEEAPGNEEGYMEFPGNLTSTRLVG